MGDDSRQDGYRDEIYSNAVRAGKRTYFFDIKSTRGGDLYLTITESKKKFHPDGKFFFEKHKIFLYKEDFEKFSEGLKDSLDEVVKLKNSGEYQEVSSSKNSTENEKESITDVSFDELD